MTPVRSPASLGPPSRVLVIKISRVDVLRTCHRPGICLGFHTSVSAPTRRIEHYFYLHLTREKARLEVTPAASTSTVNEGLPVAPSADLPRDTGFLGVGGGVVEKPD